MKNQMPTMGNQPPQLFVPGANCDVRYFDGMKTHPFCSKTCSKNVNSHSPLGICQAPNCWNAVYTNVNGSLGDYCSLAHKTLGETLCLMCLQAPKMTLSHFCSQACIERAEKTGPVLFEVPASHTMFKSVADQFKTSWRHSTHCPPVCHVYKIYSPARSLATYEVYKFGHGIYTSSTSSKSNDYSQNDCKSKLKAIILNKVVVGKGYKLTHDLTMLTLPPQGYNSVLAEKGGSLNYDELVVYTNDAIRPSFLVMYEP
ncbi:hypothetical protein AN958_02750 [Leucoagaricus sp. SymC.cos]|nr:hypothetical protein AN958_02750 [Leucoagaricus sp. SymC.cos]